MLRTLNHIVSVIKLLALLSCLQTAYVHSFRIAFQDNYHVSWEVHNQNGNSTIVFQVLAPTTGFVGLGFSPGRGMPGADIVVGGVRDGVPYLEDRHGLGNFEPVMDESQDVSLLAAWENETHTFVEFSRLLNTCDEHDVPITTDTTHLIWSFGATDDLAYHGNNRGTRAVNLLDPQGPSKPDLSEYAIWELRTNKTMPEDMTTYWCTIHKSPNIVGKHHIIGFDAILETPAAFVHTHHMEAYLCHVPEGMENVFEGYLDHPGDDCYYPKDPDFPGHHCENIAYGWAIGGQVVLFPSYVGFPLTAGEYFKLEVHYDNPTKVEGVYFETGLKLYHTPLLRPINAGRLVVGSEVNFTQTIPPNSEKFTSVAHCDVSCTAELPPNGVFLFNFLNHAHLAGRKLKLRQFRNGIELPWLTKDDNYDFNYQATRPFFTERKLLPGDHLTLECEYDSTKHGNVTIGGRSTTDEMCMTFISYYPRVEGLVNCGSEVKKDDILNFFGIEHISLLHPSDTDPIVQSPVSMQGKRFSEVVQMTNWTDPLRELYQNVTRFNQHQGYCRPSGPPSGIVVGYPHNYVEYQPIDECFRAI